MNLYSVLSFTIGVGAMLEGFSIIGIILMFFTIALAMHAGAVNMKNRTIDYRGAKAMNYRA